MRNYWPYNDPSNLAEENEQKEKCCLGCKFKKIVKNDYMSVVKCKHGNPECPDVLIAECKYMEFMR